MDNSTFYPYFYFEFTWNFLVRSGVLVSVHAFANDPTRGVYILLLLASISSTGFLNLLTIKNKIKKIFHIKLISREGMISLNNIFMLSIAFTILIRTIYPLFSSVLFNTKISVGAPFFNSILIPVMFPFVFGMILGPFTKWNRDDLLLILNRIKILLLSLILFSNHLVY